MTYCLVQIVISTGKSDWVREVTDEHASLAKYISDVNHKLGKKKQRHPVEEKDNANHEPKAISESRTVGENVSITTSRSDPSGSPVIPSLEKSPQHHSNPAGVHSYAEASRLSVLNGSQRSQGDDDNQHSVIVLPDYVVVSNVEQSLNGAEGFWRHAIASDVVRAGTERIEQGLKTYVLPYNCLILLCASYVLKILRYLFSYLSLTAQAPTNGGIIGVRSRRRNLNMVSPVTTYTFLPHPLVIPIIQNSPKLFIAKDGV